MNKSSNKLILKNTLMLYFRQILTLIVSLYTVRVVLDVLGFEDYGVYTVVGGIVMFFFFLKGTMATATQRFFSFAIGKNDEDALNKTFSVNLIIYASLAVGSLLILEVFGLWFVKDYLDVPEGREDAAILLYHFSALTFVFSIITTPFMSVIIANEDMHIFAYISILEVLLKLGVVFLLVYIPGDKLELYGFLILCVSIIVGGLYAIISIRKYKECQFKKIYWNKTLFQEIINFTGWTFFGQLSSSARNHAVVILLNQFYNPVVIAATVIARNISNQLMLFSSNFNSSLYPPIIKSYSSNDKKNMFFLVFNGSKVTFYLMWIFSLPLFFEMEFILKLWLKNIPEGVVLFSRLSLVEVLITSINLPILTAARAPGKMKSYELSLGVIQFGIFLASWLALSMGAEVYIIFVIAIVANLLMFAVRLIIVKSSIGLDILDFINQVFVPVLGVVFVSFMSSFLINFYLPKGFWFSIMFLLISGLITLIIIYFVGLDAVWREKLKKMLFQKIGYKI